MKFLTVLVTALTFFFVAADDAIPCGDWEQYKDEHCYKLFTGLQSYSDAEKLCQTNNSTLVVIHYAEEQNFLSNYIFTKKKTVNNVWVGARYIGNSLFQWEDHTQLTGGFTNWAPGYPKNLTDHCVQMLSEEGLEGKWVDERCARSNAAVCQRMPPLSLKLLAETVLELKHSLQQTASKLADTENKLAKAENKLENTEKALTSKLEQNEKTMASKVEQTEKELEKLKKENIPIGFTYVQLPKDKAPGELWPSMTWTDIFSEYEGVFFRVVGGGASGFGVVQQENAPRLEMVHTGDEKSKKIKQLYGAYSNNVSISVTGWSDGLWTGGDSGDPFFINFKHTDTAEVRPKNMAIKVYKRTA